MLAAVVLLAGCAVGPDFERPPAPEVEGYAREPLSAETANADIAGGETQRFVQGLDIPGQWWTLFHSEALNALIEQALKNNPDPAGGRGGVAPRLGERLRGARRVLLHRGSRLLAEPQQDRDRRRFHVGLVG